MYFRLSVVSFRQAAEAAGAWGTATFEWAKNMHYATLSAEQLRKAERCDLHSLPEPKY